MSRNWYLFQVDLHYIFDLYEISRGQIQAANTLTNLIDVELISEAIRYKVQASKSGLNTYFLVMNGSFKEIEVHRLSDGGMLLSFEGASYTTYMKEEVNKS